MARRRSESFHRREHEARERRRQRLIMLGAGSVIGVVALLLVIGTLWTVVLPPRAEALVVGERVLTAREVAERAQTTAVIRGAGGAQVVDLAIDQLIREEVLRQSGESLVGGVSGEDVRRAARQWFGMPEDTTDEQFETTYRRFLQDAGISERDFDRMMRAEATREALREHFEAEIEESGPQVRTLTARSRDQGRVAELRDRVLEGEDFAEVAVELELAQDEEALDRGWRAEESLTDALLDALDGLQAGEVSGIVHQAEDFEYVVHFVAEREADREYDDAIRGQIADARLARFVDGQREALDVRVELSSRERGWVVRQVQSALRRM